MDTVVITSPDINNAVLAPTLADGLAAMQQYWLLVQAAEAAVLLSQQQVNTAATEAQLAAASALAAAAAAGTASAAIVIPAITFGTATIQTRARVKRALNNAGQLQVVNDYLMNNYDRLSDTAIEWTEAPLMPVGGLVYVMIRAAIPFTDIQGRALWAAALALTN